MVPRFVLHAWKHVQRASELSFGKCEIAQAFPDEQRHRGAQLPCLQLSIKDAFSKGVDDTCSEHAESTPYVSTLICKAKETIHW